MKKVAIYTIISMNYGNRLQNYALSETLGRLGYDVETVRRFPIKNKRINTIKRTVRSFFVKDKYTNFFLFDKHIRWSDCFVNQNVYSEDLEKYYDAFVIGSDQIWNLTFDFINENSFLPFVKNRRKISYSASFGVDSFDEKLVQKLQALNALYAISVRENAGATIVEQITDRKPEVLLDPTMLLTTKQWAAVERRPIGGNLNKPYILLYFLGEVSKQRQALIDRIAAQNSMQVHTILGDAPTVIGCGPAEFLYLISHATLVLTDSFHACVFSILNQRPFAVFERKGKDANMSSRIVTLLSRFGLERKYLTESENIEGFDFFECQYDQTEQVLSKERARSEMFLIQALTGI